MSMPAEINELQNAIDKVLSQMANYDSDSEEFKKMVANLTTLHKLKQEERELVLKSIENDRQADSTQFDQNMREEELKLKTLQIDAESALTNADTQTKLTALKYLRKVSPETWALIGANILGILIIVGYERSNVVTSKALGFLSRTK